VGFLLPLGESVKVPKREDSRKEYMLDACFHVMNLSANRKGKTMGRTEQERAWG